MKPTTVKRETLLACLESVQPGLSSREISEQTDCYCFKDGYVHSFNDEIACRAPSPLPKEYTGAVKAAKCLDILRKLPEEELEVKIRDGDLVFAGKRRWAGLRLEAEIMLQFSSVERPKEWHKLPPEFGDAVSIVARCASRDQSKFVATCVHVTPKFLEASDDTQVCRWPLPLPGLPEATVVRHTSLLHVAQMGASDFSLTDNWLHFKSKQSKPCPACDGEGKKDCPKCGGKGKLSTAGLVMSCRRFVEDYPDLSDCYKVNGAKPVTLPKGLADACDKAAVFSSENVDDNLVRIDMKPGKLKIRSDGVSGWYLESRVLKYDGPALQFYCPPALLTDVVKKHNEVLISPDKIWVKATSYTWMSCLHVPQDNQPEGDGE